MNTWADHLLRFYSGLRPPPVLPDGFEWLFPQQQPEVLSVVETFLRKYFSDATPRTIFLGINPGRFGAGVTGVNFTAPRQLSEDCGIAHPFRPQSELSAEFIYRMIQAAGGPAAFYRQCFIGSVCPLGFVRNGTNINYYDDKELLRSVEPFIIEQMHRLLSFPYQRKRCICIGGEKNFKYLQKLNARHHWFDEIVPVPHPRFIMQYRRRFVNDYVVQYLRAMEGA